MKYKELKAIEEIGDNELSCVAGGDNHTERIPLPQESYYGESVLGTSRASEYEYMNVRRYALFIQEAIYKGITFSVFEP